MSGVLHIRPQETVQDGNSAIVSAVLSRDGQKPFCLWFKVPVEHREALSSTCDPFVIAALFTALRDNDVLMVHGGVSASLLRNIEEFQAVWCGWLPNRYSEVHIVPELEYDACGDSASRKAVMAFSGGLDSCFTAYRHTRQTCGRLRRELKAGVMVHGFDIPLNDESTFRAAREKSEMIVKSIGLELIPVATNFRALGDNWDHAHGAGVAACLTLFQNAYGSGLVAASFSYDSLHLNIPWGSNPLSDVMLSSDDFNIVHDGGKYSRIEKLEHIMHWLEAMEFMRVCWEGPSLDRNCCKCEKCIRGILSCRVLGIDLPACFGQDVTNDQIVNVNVPDMAILFEYRSMLTFARHNGTSASLIKLLETCIRNNERRLMGKGNLWRRTRSKVALRSRTRRAYGTLHGWLGGNDIELRKT
jgi:hypothetical protein